MACDSERPRPPALLRASDHCEQELLGNEGLQCLHALSPPPARWTPGCPGGPHHTDTRMPSPRRTLGRPGRPQHADTRMSSPRRTPGCPRHPGLRDTRDAPATLASGTPRTPGDAEHDSRAPSAPSQFSPLHPLMRLRVDHTGKP